MTTLRTRASKGSSLTHAEMDANFTRPVSQKTTTYACLVSDNRSVIECNHASTPFTVTLGDAATMAAAETGDYEVTITNIGAAVVTVARAGSDTINGSSTSLSLSQHDTVTLKVVSAGNGYEIVSETGNVSGQIDLSGRVILTDPPVSIFNSTASDGSWTDVASGVPSGSSGVIVNVLGSVTGTNEEISVSLRVKGSTTTANLSLVAFDQSDNTDAQTYTPKAVGQAMVGVDSNGDFQFNGVSSATTPITMEIKRVGYIT